MNTTWRSVSWFDWSVASRRDYLPQLLMEYTYYIDEYQSRESWSDTAEYATGGKVARERRPDFFYAVSKRKS